MTGAIRLVSIERGHEPGRFALLPFGGGGALHAGALMIEVGLSRAIVPRFPGITSALGCVIADLRHDQVQTVNLNLAGLDASALAARMVAAGQDAKAVVDAAGVAVERVDILHELDMHYLGQTHTICAPLRLVTDPEDIEITEAIVRDAFEATYRRQFSRLLPGIPVRIVSLRTAAIGRRPPFDLSALAPRTGSPRRRRGSARARSGSLGDGGTPRSGRGSISPSAPSSRDRRSWSSPTRRHCWIQASSPVSTGSAI